jgi:hypothetical protein
MGSMAAERRNLIIPEANYPISYRQEDSRALAGIIKKHESVCVVGMKKVGISTFIRFFYYNPKIKEKYFGQEQAKYLYIFCDLNDLMEIDLQTFWILVFKRLSDAIAVSNVSMAVKKKVDKLFFQSIAAPDPFFFFDNLKRAVTMVTTQTDLYLVLFLLRFDRLKDLFSKQFFANLQSLYDTAKFRVSFVTTAVRTLPELCPDVFSGVHVTTFAHSYFLKPAEKKDMRAIAYDLNLTKDYSAKINSKIQKKIFDMAGGHIMLTRLIPIVFSESKKPDLMMNEFLFDERIGLTLEEVWENLTTEERRFLFEVIQNKRTQLKGNVDYLVKAGILKKEKGKFLFFSPLLELWVKDRLKKQPQEEVSEFSKKENLLFNLLVSKKGELCRRDEIDRAVWPEYQESDDLAVSEWSIDRLVYRLREKLKLRGNKYRIITLRGRGHKLIVLK